MLKSIKCFFVGHLWNVISEIYQAPLEIKSFKGNGNGNAMIEIIDSISSKTAYLIQCDH